MRKREFVGVSTAIGVICTIIEWIAYCKGKKQRIHERLYGSRQTARF